MYLNESGQAVRFFSSLSIVFRAHGKIKKRGGKKMIIGHENYFGMNIRFATSKEQAMALQKLEGWKNGQSQQIGIISKANAREIEIRRPVNGVDNFDRVCQSAFVAEVYEICGSNLAIKNHFSPALKGREITVKL